MMNLADRALLVQLNISQWTARRVDRKASNEVHVAHRTSSDAGRYNKKLLPSADYLEDVAKKAGHIRNNVFYANTLPWGLDGTFLLPSDNYFDFMELFRKEKTEWDLLVGRFVYHYPNLIDEARLSLGSLFNEADYPPPDTIRSKFKLDLVILPVPTTDFRVQIASDELERIKQETEQRVADAASTAMKEAWSRLYETVEKINGKLSDPAAIFRDSLIENAKEICSLLTRMNIMADPNLEAMRQEVERKLAGYHPDALRTDPVLRQDTATTAKDIMSKMKVFMEGIGP